MKQLIQTIKKQLIFNSFIMKKKLLHRVLLLFVSGAMLAGVSGCKDYDDDIDNINNRLDELTTGKIASIESQLGSLQTTVTGLESLSEQVASIAGKIDGLLPTAMCRRPSTMRLPS